MTYFYDVHSLLTIASDVALPELAAFSRPTDGSDRATLRVRVRPWLGRRPAPPPAERVTGIPSPARCPDDTVVYDEGLGRLGFAVRVTLGERIAVEASPLLRHSPHVLYTYVVEPILRWTFAQRGWALVHAACVGCAGGAYLISARSDLGKTTTLLTLLRRYPKMAFLSDDLCLVRSDGSVLAYPKPMTISQHTLHAVNPRALSLAERAALVVQSRVHSRSGRRLARLLARTGLPVATISTLAQWLVPPPEYSVERLLPYAELAGGARLRGLFLIERGATDDTWQLDHETAMEMLADNSEDAFGLPPYPALESRLRHRGDADWRDREREIVGAAFDGLPATLLSSCRLDWWRRVATSIETSTARARRMAVAVASA